MTTKLWAILASGVVAVGVGAGTVDPWRSVLFVAGGAVVGCAVGYAAGISDMRRDAIAFLRRGGSNDGQD